MPQEDLIFLLCSFYMGILLRKPSYFKLGLRIFSSTLKLKDDKQKIVTAKLSQLVLSLFVLFIFNFYNKFSFSACELAAAERPFRVYIIYKILAFVSDIYVKNKKYFFLSFCADFALNSTHRARLFNNFL